MKVVNDINLVICSYGGKNRWNESLLSDRTNVPKEGIGVGPTSYLKKQIKSLNSLKHRLRQVTFIINSIPDGVEVCEGYEEAIAEIPSMLNNGLTKVKIHRRPSNQGCSLGAFSFAVGTYKNKFSYYYFLEDDGIFVKNHFDLKLIRQLEAQPSCELMVTYRRGGLFCSSGLLRSNVLPRVNWDMPFGSYQEVSRRKLYIPPENLGFVRANTFQASFLAPYKICSLLPPYGTCPYFGHSVKYADKMIFHFPGEGEEYLLVPAQMITEDKLEIVEPKFRLNGYF